MPTVNPAIQEILNKTRAKPIPYSHLFTRLIDLPIQLDVDAFGPDPTAGDEDRKFRITSKFTTGGERAAIAVTSGILFFAPHGDDVNRVNVFLKPSIDVKPANVGVKIKFYVYRGVLIRNLFKIEGSNYQLIRKEDPDAIQIIKDIWDEYLELNFPEAAGDSTGIDFFAKELGFGTAQNKLFKAFYKKDALYNLPIVRRGEEIGKFDGSIGFEIVIDEGDVLQERSDTGFDFDYDFITAKECVLNIVSNGLGGGNGADICGGRPVGFNEKIFRENVYRFMDPAAYYGAHITSASGIGDGRILYYNQNTQSSYKTKSEIYSNVVDRFATRDNIYLYIIGKRGRSYNFYNDITLDASGDYGPVKVRRTPSSNQPFINFETHGWPILILKHTDVDQQTNISSIEIQFSYSDALNNDIMYCLDTFNFSLQNNLKRTTISPPDLFRITKPNHGSLNIANFIYMSFAQDLNLTAYYNHLFGPVNLQPLFEPQDFNGEIPPQWISYAKPRLLHVNRNAFMGEMKVFFEGSPQANESGDIKYQRRLYIISPIEFSAEFAPSQYKIQSQIMEQRHKSTSFISGYGKIVHYEEADNRNEVAFNLGIELFNNIDTSVWKGEVVDGGTTIKVLALRNFRQPGEYLSKFTQLVGITQTDYGKITAGLPLDRCNEYFHFEEIPGYDDMPFSRYRLGIAYDDDNADMKIHIPTGGDEVFVYTLDGKFFTSIEYAETFPYAETLAETLVDFIPKDDWDGNYGFDWMRTGNLGYPPFSIQDDPYKDVTGTIPTQTDPNDYTSPFVKDPIMYSHMKVEEYNAIPKLWRLNENDADEEYFTPWLRIRKDQIVTLKLRIKVKTPPQRLLMEYNSENFTFPVEENNNVGSVITEGGRKYFKFDTQNWTAGALYTDLELTIKCNLLLNHFNTLVVLAETLEGGNKTTRLAGVVNIVDNNMTNIDVLFVPVKIRLPNSNTDIQYNLNQINEQKNYLQAFLWQSCINAVITIPLDSGQLVSLDLTEDKRFNTEYSGPDPEEQKGYYIYKRDDDDYLIRGNFIGQVPGGYPGFIEIRRYLSSVGTAPPARTIIVFFINHPGFIQDDSLTTQVPLGGYSHPSGNAMIFQVPNNAISTNETVPHEVYHSLGMPHTFDNTSSDNAGDRTAKYNFEYSKTDNLMDYTHAIGRERRSLSYWQWLLARKNARAWIERENN